MRLDIRELGQFNHLASQGAQRAAASLSQLTGVTMNVEVTDVSLVTDEVLKETFGGRNFVGVSVGLEGGLSGETVLAFERERAETLQKLLLNKAGASQALAQSSVSELGNIMIGGFIDGWANHLHEAINMTPPTYLEAKGTRILPRETLHAASGKGVFLFESRLEAMNVDLDFSIYMLPEYQEFVDLLSRSPSEPAIPANKLRAFDGLAKRGAHRAAEQIGMMTGMETTVNISRIRFVPLTGVPAQVGDETMVGVVFKLTGMPSGYLVILFDERSAKSVASAMMPGGMQEDGIGAMTEGAVKELGNIMTSGFIDGWANVLGTSIEHSPPNYVHDMGSSIMSPVVSKLGQRQDYAFVIDSAIEMGGQQGHCDIYALPDERELAKTLSALPSNA
ncbi:chemotaxis protein CheC [Halorubraceae archaeon YAN]|nr:chemotaxis protein CheC [Halorubraceae archaeon YAN]